MAANYWASTQRLHWTFSRRQLTDIRKGLEEDGRGLVQQYPLPELRLLSIYFNQQIGKLGRRMTVRQQALATAQVYVRRLYAKVEIRYTNPFLVLATAFYLACKTEECPQHIRLVVGEARNMWPDFIVSDTAKLGECEFFLISEMNSQMIIHQPYRSLSELQSIFSLTQDEMSLAWSVVNDHFLTDLPLLYPPHVIAITAIFLSVVLKPMQTSLYAGGTAATATAISNAAQAVSSSAGNGSLAGAAAGSNQQLRVQKLVSSLAETNVDLEAIIDCTQEIVSLYEVWEQYNEKVCKEQIARFVKARGLDK
ncbi:MAG: RNA polymerase II holoenzyme cyclin-like subunit [Candelina mexicana]|nr:MAG: RNA polymerase II holoenzyme cyclin-like subunit [Candelina mexicana]